MERLVSRLLILSKSNLESRVFPELLYPVSRQLYTAQDKKFIFSSTDLLAPQSSVTIEDHRLESQGSLLTCTGTTITEVVLHDI